MLATYPGAPTVTRLGRLLGWDPLPLTVRDARGCAARDPVDLPPPPTDTPATSGDTLVAARGLRVTLGNHPAVRNVDLDLHAGDVIALFGRNGAGKTTLLRALAELVAPSGGSVDRRARVAYVPQNPNTMLFSATVRRELEETQRLLGRPDPAAVDHWLDALHLTEFATATRAASRAVSGNGSRSPRSRSAARRSSCSTSRRAAWTRRRAPRSSTRCTSTRPAVARSCSPPTTSSSRRASPPTRSCWATARSWPTAMPAQVLAGSLFAPQVLRVLPPFLTVEEVGAELARR